ncbi:hypothetical protein AMTR_s00026p00233190 [Amborella trichopoda]|uniref:Uncharacterized protein n=1 Tax=Amborella trichopoda TaxID=13333 RepID=W1PQW1_AMBTC|nr:hypothetical protein AMTR_s00026p00233190 [Amborella trichopoda]
MGYLDTQCEIQAEGYLREGGEREDMRYLCLEIQAEGYLREGGERERICVIFVWSMVVQEEGKCATVSRRLRDCSRFSHNRMIPYLHVVEIESLFSAPFSFPRVKGGCLVPCRAVPCGSKSTVTGRTCGRGPSVSPQLRITWHNAAVEMIEG